MSPPADQCSPLRVVLLWTDDERAPGEAAIRAAIGRVPHGDTRDLRVMIDGATVVLAGSVAAARDRDALVAAVRAVPGVGEVVASRVRVRGVRPATEPLTTAGRG